jgi:hypothetical protein
VCDSRRLSLTSFYAPEHQGVGSTGKVSFVLPTLGRYCRLVPALSFPHIFLDSSFQAESRSLLSQCHLRHCLGSLVNAVAQLLLVYSAFSHLRPGSFRLSPLNGSRSSSFLSATDFYLGGVVNIF